MLTVTDRPAQKTTNKKSLSPKNVSLKSGRLRKETKEDSTPQKVHVSLTTAAKGSRASRPYRSRESSLNSYLAKARRVKLLDKEQEIKLSLLYQRSVELKNSKDFFPHDPQAKTIISRGDWACKKLVESNLRLVVSMAWQYTKKGLDIDDLIQEGNLGLMEAAKRYDGTKGYRFSTYACHWIRQSILKAICDKSRNIRIPVYLWNWVNSYNKIKAQEEMTGVPLSDEEIREKLGLSEAEYKRVQNSFSQILSIDYGSSNPSAHNNSTSNQSFCSLGRNRHSDSFHPKDFTADDCITSSSEHHVWREHLRDCFISTIAAVREVDAIWADVLECRHPLEPGVLPMTHQEIGKKYDRGPSWSSGKYQDAKLWLQNESGLDWPVAT